MSLPFLLLEEELLLFSGFLVVFLHFIFFAIFRRLCTSVSGGERANRGNGESGSDQSSDDFFHAIPLLYMNGKLLKPMWLARSRQSNNASRPELVDAIYNTLFTFAKPIMMARVHRLVLPLLLIGRPPSCGL